MLRKVKDLENYEIAATDCSIGHVKDFYFDDHDWVVRYLVVDAGTWLTSRKVLVAPPWINDVRWTDRSVSLNMTRDAIKGAPLYDSSEDLNRNLEIGPYEYYGRPGYWTDNRLYKSKVAA